MVNFLENQILIKYHHRVHTLLKYLSLPNWKIGSHSAEIKLSCRQLKSNHNNLWMFCVCYLSLEIFTSPSSSWCYQSTERRENRDIKPTSLIQTAVSPPIYVTQGHAKELCASWLTAKRWAHAWGYSLPWFAHPAPSPGLAGGEIRASSPHPMAAQQRQTARPWSGGKWLPALTGKGAEITPSGTVSGKRQKRCSYKMQPSPWWAPGWVTSDEENPPCTRRRNLKLVHTTERTSSFREALCTPRISICIQDCSSLQLFSNPQQSQDKVVLVFQMGAPW